MLESEPARDEGGALHGILRLLPVVLILASACSRDSPDPSDVRAPDSGAFSMSDALRPNGPLRGVAFTGHVDREDPKLSPTLAFTTADTEVTAVIGLGDVREGSTVIVTWYRVVGLEEREPLFSHEIAVGPGGLAFSQAVAPKGLAPGIYDTAARMDGHVVHTPWVVREVGVYGTGATAQAASSDEAGDVPGSGESWSNDGAESPPPPGTPNVTCAITSINAGMDQFADVSATVSWLGPCTTGTLNASVSGPPTTLASSDSLQGESNLWGKAWVCSISGGTDMPGTVVRFEVTGSASASEDYTLPDNGELLLVMLGGEPRAGSKVEQGDRIKILAIATVPASALGVKSLSVHAGTDLVKTVGNISGTDQPVPCDSDRFHAMIIQGLNETAYEVPSNPPPVIELCATAVGFDGTESKDCIRYYTGKAWKGTANITSSAVYPGGSASCQDGWELEFTFGVDSDGVIEGQGTAELTTPPTCSFPIDNVPSVTHAKYQVLGEETAGGFSLRFALAPWGYSSGATLAGFFSIFSVPASPTGGPPVAVGVSGSNGTGQGMWQFRSGNPPATYSANGTIKLECVASCEPTS